MSSHNNRSRYNSNETSSNNVHDKERAGVPDNIPMLEHIGDSSSVDRDVGYTELQRDIIQRSEDKLYNRRQHDVRFDLPEGSYDPIKVAHPLGVTAVNSHGDRGYDYRDYPENVAQDHEKFDPYIQYLHTNGLIGLNKKRYIINHVNIDSRDRNKMPCTKNDTPIRLDPNPLTFNSNILRLDITNVDQSVCNRLTPGTKIVIRGLEEYQYTLRTAVPDNFGNLVESFIFEEGKQYMRVDANNNIDVQTGNINDVKEDYADIKVRFEGFTGDLRKVNFYNFSGFQITSFPDPLNSENTVFEIREDVYGDQLFKIADFKVDRFGVVIEDNTQRPYLDVITWTNPAAATNPISLSPAYFTAVANDLTGTPAPSLPTTFTEYINYIEDVQNITRPHVFTNVGGPDTAFVRNYQDNNDSYQTTVRFNLDELTQCTQTSRIGNIPLNFLNMSHRIFFTASDVEASIAGDPLTTDIPSDSNFFIELDREYIQSPFVFTQPVGSSILQVTTFETTLSDVLVAFKHYGGVPIRSINAEYPLGPQADAGFRFVIDLLQTGGRKYALVQLTRPGYLNRAFGGDCLTFAFVDSEETGFIQPNRYVVEFGRVFYKVASIKMVSSQFPIAQKAFQDGVTGGVKNNLFCWQNLNDGSIIYSIEVEPGDYTSEELEKELERKVLAVDRFDEEIPRNIPNIMRFDIDPNTDLVKISSFNYYKAPGEPFLLANNLFDINTPGSPENLDPENAYYIFPTGGYFTDFPKFSGSCQCFRIKVFYPNHGLKQFDEFIIEGSTNFGQIPADLINGPRVVTQVIDDNNYDFVINNVNLTELQSFTVTGTIDPITGTFTANTNGTINANTVSNLDADLTGDIDTLLTGTVDTTGIVSANLDLAANIDTDTTGTITAGVTGDIDTTISGDFDGDITGDINTTIAGNIDGVLDGEMTGDINTTIAADFAADLDATANATVDLDVTGSINANASATVDLDLDGSVDLDTIGTVTGGVTGDLLVDVSGNVNVMGDGDVDVDAEGTITGTISGVIATTTEGEFSGTAELNATITQNASNSMGGFCVVILTPNKFRLRFDKPDTIGTQLGFRDVGLCTSITPYDTMITNDTLYEDEDIVNVLSLINPDIDISTIDTSDIAIRNSVILVGPPYLLITCSEIHNVRGRGAVKDIFYKINLRDNSRNSGADDRVEPMAYDTYADTPIFYNEPLRRLEKLTLEFLTPDGDRYDFNGVNHSFVLEIVTYEEIPEATSLQKN
jgi:hypothetical protein